MYILTPFCIVLILLILFMTKWIKPTGTHENVSWKCKKNKKQNRKLYDLISESSVLSYNIDLVCNW